MFPNDYSCALYHFLKDEKPAIKGEITLPDEHAMILYVAMETIRAMFMDDNTDPFENFIVTIHRGKIHNGETILTLYPKNIDVLRTLSEILGVVSDGGWVGFAYPEMEEDVDNLLKSVEFVNPFKH